ncbi:MAG: LysR family transcriptional regulator [Trebonia sp.]|jgi:DNA-binding transcriptional LysR family regulator
MLNLRRMLLLRDLADLGTVTAVAERRNVTASAVSQQLRVLEAETGTILFQQDGRTLGLTRAGDILVGHVRRVLAAIDEAESAVAAARQGVAGHVSIASFNMGIPMLVAPAVERLGQRVPHLELEVQQTSSDAALRLLRQGEVDVAIILSYEFQQRPSLGGTMEEKLLDEPVVLLAPAELHLRVRKHGFAALADQPWVTGPPATGLAIALERAADDAGFTPRVKHRVEGAQNICRLATTEMAVALVPRLAVPVQHEGLIVDSVDLGVRTISAVVREGRRRDPNIRQVIRELHAIVVDSSRETLEVAV